MKIARPNWIPVTERLPEDNTVVLVLYDDWGKIKRQRFLNGNTEYAKLFSDPGEWGFIGDDFDTWRDTDYAPTGWLPLPPATMQETKESNEQLVEL